MMKFPILAFVAQSMLPAACADLASLHPPNTAITLAQTVEAGALPRTGPRQAPNLFKTLPAFCRVGATLTPSSDSDIKIEVWLPAENWNGKFQAVGNSGWGGYISYPAMARALAHGYATANAVVNIVKEGQMPGNTFDQRGLGQFRSTETGAQVSSIAGHRGDTDHRARDAVSRNQPQPSRR